MSWHQGGAFNQYYDMWVENTASTNCQQFETGLDVNVGDRMYAVVGGAALSTAAAVYIADQTLGVAYQSIHGPYANWPNPDQNTAECLVERNHWQGGLGTVMQNMTDFGNVYFNYCRATTNYTTETGIGSVANMVPDHFWYYYLSGGELPCVTVDDFDSSSNWNYYAVSNESTYPQC